MQKLLLLAVFGFFLCPIFAQTEFITTWKTDNPGPSADNQITIPTFTGEIYNYTVDWGDGTSDSNVTGNITHDYAVAGTYQVTITGDFPRIYFHDSPNVIEEDKNKILSIDQWGVIEWSSMRNAFYGCENLDVLATDTPDLSSVTDMVAMFRFCSKLIGTNAFNAWDVSQATLMLAMFEGALLFNQDIGNWDVSSAVNMSAMFSSAELFNQDIGNWNVESATSMIGMFREARAFNQDIGGWDTSSLAVAAAMFRDASAFNQDLNSWDVSNLFNLEVMFMNATSFNQDLSGWDVSNASNMSAMFDGSSLSNENYDRILLGWNRLDPGESRIPQNVDLGASDNTYCISESARESLINTYNWEISDAGLNCVSNPFVTTWKTDNPGASADNQITIPTFPGETYDYNVDWGDGSSDSNVTGNITHTYASAGTYVVSISGNFPRIYFTFDQDPEKLLSVDRWGDISWSSMENAFASCLNMDVIATDIPDFSNLSSLRAMFRDCSSLQMNNTINNWDTSSVTDMSLLFAFATQFNQNISNWDTSNVTTMEGIFVFTDSFNQPIGSWDTSSLGNMRDAFNMAGSFDQDISQWDVSNVSDFTRTFSSAVSFNQPLNNWDVSGGTNFEGMFEVTTAFNQDLSNWDVSNAVNMTGMFRNAEGFDQDLGSWNVGNVTSMTQMFANNAGLSDTNYENILIGWSQLPVLQNGVVLDAFENSFCNAEIARKNIIDNFGWQINDLGKDCPFITTWKTDNPGVSSDNQVRIPTFPGETYNYNVDWGDGNSDNNVSGDITHTYSNPGTYVITISGLFPSIYFNEITDTFATDRLKLISLDQWGSNPWTVLDSSFAGCENLDVLASEIPDLSNVTSTSSMFYNCFSLAGNSGFSHWDTSNIVNMARMFYRNGQFNQDIGNWDVSGVTNMFQMFFIAESFNQDLGSWNVSNVSNMSNMFTEARAFNQDISNWDVSNVTEMASMFGLATSFNRNLNNWDVSNVTNMSRMFENATSFNGNISNWDVSNVSAMGNMFIGGTSFNQDISNWNVANVTEMSGMFAGAISFDQDLGGWDVSNVVDMTSMLFDVALSTANYDNLLIGWSSLPGLQGNVVFNAGISQFCDGAIARQSIIDNFGWTISDEGENPHCNQDNDIDGVFDHLDLCLNTRSGVAVTPDGCEIIPADAIRIIANSTLCPGENNGSFAISTELEGLDFNINVNGSDIEIDLNNIVVFPSYTINDLAAGEYLITISIPSALFEQQYGIRIREIEDIAGKRQVVDRTERSVTYIVSGSKQYWVDVNGNELLFEFNSVDSQLITLENLVENNVISIKGTNDCQGLYTDSFVIDNELILYPVLTDGLVFIDGPLERVTVELFDLYGRLVNTEVIESSSEPSINLDGLPNAVYLIKITNNGISKTHKIIKQ